MQSNKAWADEAVKQKKKIQIVGADKKYHVTPFYFTPRENEHTKKIELGCEFPTSGVLNDGDKIRKKIHPIAKELLLDKDELTNMVPITHLQTLDLGVDRDAAIMYMLTTYPETICVGKDNINPTTHRFYFRDAKAEKVSERNRVLDRVKVVKLVQEIPKDDLAAYLRLVVGFKPTSQDTDDLLTDLILEAEKSPTAVMKVIDDPDNKVAVFAAKCLNKGILKHDKANSQYKADNLVIGSSFEQVVAFLQQEENVTLKNSWAKMI